jgi:hypothetical protein
MTAEKRNSPVKGHEGDDQHPLAIEKALKE